MVAFGDPRSPVEPFEIDCAESGTGRWIDSRTWVYDFTRDAPGGLRCQFRLRPGLETQAGKPISGRRVFHFSTGGPAIQATVPSADSRIEEEQAFVLGLNAPPSEESVLRHVSFAVAGIPERVGVRVIAGEAR